MRNHDSDFVHVSRDHDAFPDFFFRPDTSDQVTHDVGFQLVDERRDHFADRFADAVLSSGRPEALG